jgi:hypothetical protein
VDELIVVHLFRQPGVAGTNMEDLVRWADVLRQDVLNPRVPLIPVERLRITSVALLPILSFSVLGHF